jgi:hypothetical protein
VIDELSTPEPIDFTAELERLEAEYRQEKEAQPATETEAGTEAEPDLPEIANEIFPYGPNTAELTNRVSDLEEQNNLLQAHVLDDIRQRDIADALKTVRETYDLDIGDEPLRQLMTGMVNEDIGLYNAWQNRNQDPQTWQNALKHLGRKVAKNFTRNNLVTTSDLEALEASIRGQTVEAPRKRLDATGVGNMTHAAYAAWKRETLGS